MAESTTKKRTTAAKPAPKKTAARKPAASKSAAKKPAAKKPAQAPALRAGQGRRGGGRDLLRRRRRPRPRGDGRLLAPRRGRGHRAARRVPRPGRCPQLFTELFAAMPDFEFTVTASRADHEVAAVQWRATGTFTGAPFQGVEPTGKRVELRGTDCRGDRGTAGSPATPPPTTVLAFARAIGMLPAREQRRREGHARRPSTRSPSCARPSKGRAVIVLVALTVGLVFWIVRVGLRDQGVRRVPLHRVHPHVRCRRRARSRCHSWTRCSREARLDPGRRADSAPASSHRRRSRVPAARGLRRERTTRPVARG